MPAEKEFITAHELAGALDLSVETIWRYTREEKIPFIKLGGKQYRYRLKEVIKALSGSGVREQTADYGGGRNDGSGKMTYEDYCALPEEAGYRYEVLDGVLVKDPSPNVPHQRATARLFLILSHYFKSVDPEGEVFIAPLDLTLGRYIVVQPDIIYVSGKQDNIVRYERIDGTPTLAVEVISPSSARKDRVKKMAIYQEAGVSHYWLVDPAERTLECFSLRNGLYTVVAGGMDEEVVRHPGLEGLEIELKGLWKK